MNPALLIAMAALSGSAITLAGWLMLRVSDKDELLAGRVRAAQGHWARVEPALQRRGALLDPFKALLAGAGRSVLNSGVLPSKTRAEMRQSLQACGYTNPNAVALFLGAKLVLLIAGPLTAWLTVNTLGLEQPIRSLTFGAGIIVGLLAPDWIVSRMRKSYVAKLEAAIPDALDLLVICAQAGLSLQPAMARVASEMRLARPEIAAELDQTIRELEVMADPQVALGNLAQRTGLPTLKRLVATLLQTLQYGTPLTDALRHLSAEVRQAALTRFEEGAARLSVLLTLPMILFILPCVFIVVGGPAMVQVMRTFGK